MIAKRGYMVRVLAQPTPTITTPTAPPPPVATASTQMPATRSAAMSMLVTVYKLATRQFAEVPHPTPKPQNEGHHWKIYPMPQSDRVLLGLAQGQPQKIYLKPEDIDQFPLPQHLHLSPL